MKSVRQIAIADHLWDVLSRMAEDMGSDREALLNQALHQLARQHGYLGAPGDAADTTPGPDRSERLAVAERVLETAARLERAMHDRTPGEGPLPLGEEAGSTLGSVATTAGSGRSAATGSSSADSHPPIPGAPRCAFHQASFWLSR